MAVERIVRGVAGPMLLAGLTQAMTHHKNWLLLTMLVGLNLLQSAFANRCPSMATPRHFGVKQG